MPSNLIDFLESMDPVHYPEGDSDWLDFAMIDVPSGKLFVSDPLTFPGLIVELQPGYYSVKVMVSNNNATHVVKGLQVIRPEVKSFRRGCSLGEVSIDFSRLTVGDHKSTEEAYLRMMLNDLQEPFNEALDTDKLYGTAPWTGSVTTPFICTDGDGRFTVWELIDGNSMVGVEVILDYEDED